LDFLGKATAMPVPSAHFPIDSSKLLNALPVPVLAVLPNGLISDANTAAEIFFGMSRTAMWSQKLIHLVSLGSPLLVLVEQVKTQGVAINEYRVDLGLPNAGDSRIVDIFVSPLSEVEEGVLIMLQERSITDKVDRQLTHRGAARSVAAMASVLAHEIKNPLSGIRGAAQLIEAEASEANRSNDRALTKLICDETDRIVKLVDRMSAFSDMRPLESESVNVHAILDHVKKVSQAGFARHIKFHENYDPSLPQVRGNRDQLVQVFLNLVKNAAESIGANRDDGDIELSSAFRPGVRLQLPGTTKPVSLPLEFCVRDNGPGVPEDVLPYLFDPFITTKATGSGLGLALVAKIVGDHGGIIECESHARRTTFRVLMPIYALRDGRGLKLDESGW
jgi:two-component system nitrogen regulation sensor histidine kinase GlnL